MLIMSWNVAGLGTTMNRIHDAYRPAKSSLGTAPHPSAALRAFLQRHQADILCVQEHKIPRTQLSNRSEPRQLSSVEGYESFWSCCVDENKKGFNGCVTYARQGTVVRACITPLGSPDLDHQGRCVMTDHGTFCLFNVYVPASGGQPLAYKMKFLNALRRAMKRQRDAGKAVILAGDLNISHTELDIYWKDRAVHVDDVLLKVASSSNPSELAQWERDIAKHWALIQSTLENNKEVVPTKTTNSLTSESYNKYRLCVHVNERKIFLGKHETSPEYCLYCYDFSEYTYVDEDSGESILARERNSVPIEILAELLFKIAGVEWDEDTMRLIANTHATVSRASPPRKWLTSVLQQDGMVDVFRHFYPKAEARFTCWHQFTNQRYINAGARIDYTLVDDSLLEHVQQGASCLRCCGSPTEDHLSESSALCAATANGQFHAVSFHGGGIQEATQAALDTQFGAPHTGMMYTPPSFSDHIAVSLLLQDSIMPTNQILDGKDAQTRKAQPHKLQTSIASFFRQASSGDRSTASSSNRKMGTGASRFRSHSSKSGGSRVAKKKPVVKNSILDHFVRKTKK